MKALTVTLFSLFFISCGQQVNPFDGSFQTQSIESESAVTEQYHYELTEVDCTTGEQSKATFNEICVALKDDNINNQCAKEDREILFNNSRCEGTF